MASSYGSHLCLKWIFKKFQNFKSFQIESFNGLSLTHIQILSFIAISECIGGLP